MRTICIPKNLNFLSETLHPANYDPLKLKVIEKGRFLKTLQEAANRPSKKTMLDEDATAGAINSPENSSSRRNMN